MALCTLTADGRLGGDAEMRYTKAGQPVASFRLAVSQGRKDPETGEWSDETDWFRVTAWGNLGERVAKLEKGDRVIVVGRFRTQEWTDRNNAVRLGLELTAQSVTDVSGKPAASAAEVDLGPDEDAPFVGSVASTAADDRADDELPF